MAAQSMSTRSADAPHAMESGMLFGVSNVIRVKCGNQSDPGSSVCRQRQSQAFWGGLCSARALLPDVGRSMRQQQPRSPFPRSLRHPLAGTGSHVRGIQCTQSVSVARAPACDFSGPEQNSVGHWLRLWHAPLFRGSWGRNRRLFDPIFF